MNTYLKRSDSEILELFWEMPTKYHVANILEISFGTLVYLLYRSDKPIPYTTFVIRKKSGGEREISAPNRSLKILQRKLNYILNFVYRPRLSVYGFCKGKNILGNARIHTGKKVVFNLDLEEFFPSIHIGRVIGLFKSKPFNFPSEVATVLAQICCHKGKLPQGAPTSPIIANMICAGLDTELQALAKLHHCVYTRYADDISFSTIAKKLSEDIASETTGEARCGAALASIIERHGFKINQSKVRIQLPIGRQEVTGLVVNEFPNVHRKYIREIRSMLHAWRKFGEENAGVYYFSRKLHVPENPVDFRVVVGGKLSFLRMVRGEKDPIYRKLSNKYRKLIDPASVDQPVGLLNELKASLWVVQTAVGYAGTAFLLDGVGLITCAHVVKGSAKVDVINWLENKSYEAVVTLSNETPDLAILEIKSIPAGHIFSSLKRGARGTVKERDLVTIAGFPGYEVGDPPQCWDARVSAKRPDPTNGTGIYVERFTIDKMLIKGMSGSPVVDEENNVVAVATFGSPTIKEISKIWDYGITPIYHLDNMA